MVNQSGRIARLTAALILARDALQRALAEKLTRDGVSEREMGAYLSDNRDLRAIDAALEDE